ncbi:MAG: hypothetical protein QM485_11025 [Flavobacteriaceae bacterium]
MQKIATFTKVTKLFSILISLLLLFQSVNMSISDLAQIDELIEHAQFHNEQYGDSFFVFVSKHYGELKAEHSKKHQEEKCDHEDLPFNHNSCTHITSVTTYVLNKFKAEIKSLFFSKTIEANFYYQGHTSSLHAIGFFQPPRFS